MRSKVILLNRSIPTGPFAGLEPENLDIGEFDKVQKRRPTDFKALRFVKGLVGLSKNNNSLNVIAKVLFQLIFPRSPVTWTFICLHCGRCNNTGPTTSPQSYACRRSSKCRYLYAVTRMPTRRISSQSRNTWQL